MSAYAWNIKDIRATYAFGICFTCSNTFSRLYRGNKRFILNFWYSSPCKFPNYLHIPINAKHENRKHHSLIFEVVFIFIKSWKSNPVKIGFSKASGLHSRCKKTYLRIHFPLNNTVASNLLQRSIRQALVVPHCCGREIALARMTSPQRIYCGISPSYTCDSCLLFYI